MWRLTKALTPQFQESTVRIIADERTESARKSGVISTGGIDEKAETARNEDVLARTLRGEPLAEPTGTKEQLDKAHRQWAAIENAIEHVDREIQREKAALSIQYCNSLKAKEADLVRKVCKPMLELHSAWSDLYSLKRHLTDAEVGLRGICLIMPDFLSAPNNKFSEMGDFLRAARNAGYIKEIPVEYRT